MLRVLQTVFVLGYFFIGTESFRTPLDPKIVGGTEVTNRSEFPYQAGLIYKETTLRCGASIINEKFVLTAAGCIIWNVTSMVEPSDIKIVTGNLLADDHTIMKDVKTIYIHADYDPSTLSKGHDIALIQIIGSFAPWTENVQPISLKFDETTTGSCIVSGWGQTTLDGPSSNKLMSAEVPVIDWQTCNDAYSNGIPEDTICAGEKDKGGCKGDGGGPLVCSGQLAGIISYGMGGCVQEDHPLMHTEVAAYLGWIVNIILPQPTTTSSTSTSTTPATTTNTPCGKGFAVANRDSVILWLLATVSVFAIS